MTRNTRKVRPTNAEDSKDSDTSSVITASSDEKSMYHNSEQSTKPSASSRIISQTHSRTTQGSKKSRVSKKSDLVLKKYTGVARYICFFPQLLLKITYSMPITLKLLFLAVIPFVSLVTISVIAFVPMVNGLIEVRNAQLTLRTMNLVTEASIAINRERGEFVRYSILGGEISKRQEAYFATNAKLRELDDLIPKLKFSSARLNSFMDSCKNISTHLIDLRSRAGIASELMPIFVEYDGILESLDTILDPLNWDPNFVQLSNYGNLRYILQKYLTATGSLRDLLTYRLHHGYFSSMEEYEHILTLIYEWRQYLILFVRGHTSFQNVESDTIISQQVLDASILTSIYYFNSYTISIAVDGHSQNITENPVTFYEHGRDLVERLADFSQSQEVVMDDLLDSRVATRWTTMGVLLSIIILTVLLSCFVTCICAECIYRPWRLLMKKREQMLNESIVIANAIVRLDSNLLNQQMLEKDDEMLNGLELALKQIALQFFYFQPYLPQSVIAAAREKLNLEEAEPIKKLNHSRMQKDNVRSSTKESSRENSQMFSSLATSQSKRRSHQLNSTQAATPSSTFTYKDISALIIDIVDIHDLLEGFASSDIIDVHAELMTVINDTVVENNGIVEIIQDKFVCTFNAVTSTLGPEKRACCSALAIADNIDSKLLPMWKEAELPQLKVNMAIVTGSAFVGTVGNQSIRSFVTLAPMLSKLWKLVKLNHVYKPVKRILIDDTTAKKIDLQFVAKIQDAVKWKHILHMSKKELIFSLEAQHAFKNDEWMYEYSELEKKKEKGKEELIDAWRLMIRDDIEDAWKKLYAYKRIIIDNSSLQENTKESVARLEEHLRNAENNNLEVEK